MSGSITNITSNTKIISPFIKVRTFSYTSNQTFKELERVGTQIPMEPQFSTRIQPQTLLPSTDNLRLTHFIYWYICQQKEKKREKNNMYSYFAIQTKTSYKSD